MKIILFQLFDRFSVGGITSFTNHLYLQLVELGYKPVIVTRNTAFKFQAKELLPTSYLSDEEIVEISRAYPCLITFCSWGENRLLVKQLIYCGVPIVIHDPVEYSDELLWLADTYSGIITIRKQNTINLKERGYTGTWIRHPYVKAGVKKTHKAGAVTCTRLAYNKGCEIIIEANNNKCLIDMYGEMNKDYFMEQLSKRTDWRKYYKGYIDNKLHAVPNVLCRYKYAIDLTLITLDGGGTQYSFLESWDADCMLIVSKKWILNNDDLVSGLNCLAVSNETELKEVIEKNKEYDIAIHSTILEKHNTLNSGSKFADYILFQDKIRKRNNTQRN